MAAAIRAALELKLHDSRSHEFAAGVTGRLFTLGWIAARGFETRERRALLCSRRHGIGAVRPQKGRGEEMKPLWEAADFVRRLRRERRFGELSRAPLQLLRLELRGGSLACDWMVRPADIWDANLRQSVRDRNESLQALADAIAVRDLAFDALPNLQTAVLRAFRPSAAREPPELIIAGSIHRGDPEVYGRASLMMRAKLTGFHFCLEGQRLESIRVEEFEMSLDRAAAPSCG
jgi:hypothetical protein